MRVILTAIAIAIAAPAFAQNSDEIIVTANRRQADDDDARVPAIGMRRVADFAVQMVVIAGDTRERDKRQAEIYAMLKGAVELAARGNDIALATGEMVVEPVTLANYRSLTLSNDGRPDSERTSFLIKTRLSGSVDAKAALERINAFIKAVPTVGRAEMKRSGDLTLSIVNPGQYRGAILDLVATDAKATSARLGEAYGVDAKGLDRSVEWSRASLTEVFLYVPYSYTVQRAK